MAAGWKSTDHLSPEEGGCIPITSLGVRKVRFGNFSEREVEN